MLQSYKEADPGALPALALPVSCFAWLEAQAVAEPRATPLDRLWAATDDLIILAFFFLLHVGEYTPARAATPRRTVALRKKDIQLWDGNHQLLSLDAPDAILATAVSISISLVNQKNGVRFPVRRHSATNAALCPVRAVIRRLRHLRGDPDSTPLSTVHHSATSTQHVTPAVVTSRLHLAALATGILTMGFLLARISTHSVRASGATALKLNGVSDSGVCDSDIQFLGRWSSNTFVQYIQVQLCALARPLAARMIHYIPYYNISPNER